MVYVYLLKDGNNKVVDVGESQNPKGRLRDKTKCISLVNKGCTNFYGRTDITHEVVSSWPTRKQALVEEKRLKLLHGLQSTEEHRGKPRKLTMAQAEEIRSKYVPYKYNGVMLAKEYGVSTLVIHKIIHNQTYTY
tara:strand:- start:80 stop:484 length:405 start_codon:yes stop_codon:yes gene_type:complete